MLDKLKPPSESHGEPKAGRGIACGILALFNLTLGRLRLGPQRDLIVGSNGFWPPLRFPLTRKG